MVHRRLLLLAFAGSALVGCVSGIDPPALSGSASTSSTASLTAPSADVTTTIVAAAVAPDAALVTTPFAATVMSIDGALAERLASSWRPGCPVRLDELRYLTLRYWGFDDAVHDGELVVHVDQVDAMIAVFSDLFAARFPIERMRLVDDYGGDDNASMRANNTSAFNCREVDGRPGVMSNHSWGAAIDINPLRNPWVNGTAVHPPEAALFADRSEPVRGGIYRDDVVTQAFARVRWGWGGDWAGSKDWQHFSASGN